MKYCDLDETNGEGLHHEQTFLIVNLPQFALRKYRSAVQRQRIYFNRKRQEDSSHPFQNDCKAACVDDVAGPFGWGNMAPLLFILE